MTDTVLIDEAVTRSIIGAFYEVYNNLGYGFVEHIYSLALEYELRSRGHTVVRELSVNVIYKDRFISQQRMDMVVDDLVVVESKAGARLHPHAARQLFNYLHATNYQVGLLLHFGPEPKFHREVHTLKRPVGLIREIRPFGDQEASDFASTQDRSEDLVRDDRDQR